MIKLETYVDGLGFTAVVTNYRPSVPAKVDGPPETCHPGEAEELEFELWHRSRRVEAFEWRLSDRDLARLTDRVRAVLRAEAEEGELARAGV